MTKLTRTLAILTLVLAGLLLPAVPAAASTPVVNEPIGYCAMSTFDRYDWYWVYGNVFQHSGTLTTPSWSACRDISALTNWGQCVYARVKFFRSDGTTFVNSWKNICYHSTPVTIAWGVYNGTRFKIQIQPYNAGGVPDTMRVWY